MTAHSFRTTASIADDLAAAFTEATELVNKASGGLVFVSGTLAQQTLRIAEHLRSVWRGVPACVIPGAGVLNERGELERVNAASGILWSGGASKVVAIEHAKDTSPEAIAEHVGLSVGYMRQLFRSEQGGHLLNG